MTKKNQEIDNLVSDLLDKPKAVCDDKVSNLKKIVIPGHLLEDDIEEIKDQTIVSSNTVYGDIITGCNHTINNYFDSSKQFYKRDKSASSIHREIIDYRDIGKKVDVHHMTRNEYISYLGYLYQLANVHKWDGIERLYHRPNWTADFSHNVQNYDEALEFIGIEKNESAPDGLEKRHIDRRQGLKDIRLDNINRRVITEKGRRKEDHFNYLAYFATVIILLIVIIGWIAYSIKEFTYG